MSDRVFIDTNIIVYANDKRDPLKQRVAVQTITEHMQEGSGVISVQVMQEYAAVAHSKLGQAPDVILRQLRLLEAFELVCIDPHLVRRAVEHQVLHRIAFWDACIIAAAEHAACRKLLSEDLNPGQRYGDVKVVNPFS